MITGSTVLFRDNLDEEEQLEQLSVYLLPPEHALGDLEVLPKWAGPGFLQVFCRTAGPIYQSDIWLNRHQAFCNDMNSYK